MNLVEVDGRRYAILPESTPENPLGIMDGRPTVRLSSELEQQLTNALTALSEQYEREQRRQVELLRRDYKEIAEVLRGV